MVVIDILREINSHLIIDDFETKVLLSDLILALLLNFTPIRNYRMKRYMNFK